MQVGGASSTRTRKAVLGFSAASFLCFSITVVYFYRFPTLVNPTVSDAFILTVLIIWGIALFGSSLVARRQGEVGLVLVGISMFGFVARAIPLLRLGVPFLHDPYFFMASTQDVLGSGSLSPTLSALYPQVGDALVWPLMQLISVTGETISGSGVQPWFSFQAPVLGALTSVATFLLARTITARTDVPLVAALLAASSDIVIYYQAEYHPQGLALLLLVFFLYVFLRSRAIVGLAFEVLSLIFAASLIFVHDFSSLFIALLAMGFIAITFVSDRSPLRRLVSTPHGDGLRTDYTLWTLVAVAALAYHFFFYPSVATAFIVLLEGSAPQGLLVTVGPRVPLFASLGNATKYVILLLALLAIWRLLRSLTRESYRLLIALALLLAAGILSDFVTGGPSERVVAFYVPIAAVFAGIGVLYVMGNHDTRSRRASLRRLAASGVVVAVVVIGVLNSEIPALYCHTSTPNPYYASSNDLSTVGVYQATGSWIARYTAPSSTYTTEFDTRMIPFYYAGKSVSSENYVDTGEGKLSDFAASGFFVLNPSITYYYQGSPFNKTAFLQDSLLVYSNGYVTVGWVPPP